MVPMHRIPSRLKDSSEQVLRWTLSLNIACLLVSLVASIESFKVPAGSSCDLGSLNLTEALKQSQESKELDQLIQKSPNSAVAQFLPTPNQYVDQSIHQHSFDSICFGWKTNVNRNQDHRPVAFWIHDELRSILLAKFIYYTSTDYFDISQREASLVSPIFRSNPTIVRDIEPNCQLQFSSYLTLPAHLDVYILIVNSMGKQVEVRQRKLLKKIVGRTILGRQKLMQAFDLESSLWIEHSVDLYPNLLPQDSFYAIEFTAFIGKVTSDTIRYSDYLNGVAIANISIGSQCFGWDGIDELTSSNGDENLVFHWPENSKNLADLSSEGYAVRSSQSGSFWELVENHKLSSLFITLLVIMILVTLGIQFFLCAFIDPPSGDNRCPARSSIWSRYSRVYQNPPPSDKQRISRGETSDQMSLIHINGNTKMRQKEIKPQRDISVDLELIELATYLDELNSGLDSPKPRDLLQVDRRQLEFIKILGKGAFGSVYQGELRLESPGDWSEGQNKDGDYVNSQDKRRQVAIKMLSDERVDTTDDLREFINEALNLSRASHRNIVQLIGVSFTEKPFYIVMELMSGGSLKHFLDKSQLDVHSLGLTMGDLLVFSFDIARACDYVRNQNLIHRDLAARNCLLSSSGVTPRHKRDRARSSSASSSRNKLNSDFDCEPDLEKVYLNGFDDSGMVVKLADFGMTRHLVEENNYYLMNITKEVPVRWMAPECANYKAVANSDVWSFGIVLWEIFSLGQMPYREIKNNNQVLGYLRLLNDFVEDRKEPDRSSNFSIDSDYSVPDETRKEPAPTIVINSTNYQTLYDREPPLGPPQPNTPDSIYSIMCACWPPDPKNRPNFHELAMRIYFCLQDSETLQSPIRLNSEQTKIEVDGPIAN